MIYKGSPDFWKGHSWEFDWRVFRLGLSLIDVNFMAYGWWSYGCWSLEGKTILSIILDNFRDHDYWVVGVDIVEEVLKQKSLDLSLMNKKGETALDFLVMYENRNMPADNESVENARSKPIQLCDESLSFCPQNPKSLLPVVYSKIDSEFSDDLPHLSLDTQLLNVFKKRQEEFKDLDMNFAKQSLLSKAIRAFRLDLVRFLIIDCEVDILQTDRELWGWLCGWETEDREWCQARDVLTNVLSHL